MVKETNRSKSFAANRERILRAATELFGSKGFDGTSVRNIAERAGLSVPGMFHYFSTKEEMLYEIMARFMDDSYAKLMEIYKAHSDPIEKIGEVCKFYVEQYAGHKHELTLLTSERRSLLPEHQAKCIKKEREYVAALKNLFEELARRKLLKPIDHSILAFIFFGMVHWTYRWYNPDASGGVKPNQLGKIFSEIFLRGIIAPKPR